MIKPVSLNQSQNTKPWRANANCGERERVGPRNIFLDFNACWIQRAELVLELSQITQFVWNYQRWYFLQTRKEWICSYGFSINYYLLFYTSSMFYLPSPDYFIGNNHIYTRLMPLRQQWKKPINAITKPCNSNIFTTLLSVMVFIFDVQKCKANGEEIDNKLINRIPWLFLVFFCSSPNKKLIKHS